MAAKGQSEDILWKMLSEELDMEQIRELQGYLRGESDHIEMGYGGLVIEPYDGSGGKSTMFRVRHDHHGEVFLSHAALGSVLHDLLHYRRKELGKGGVELN